MAKLRVEKIESGRPGICTMKISGLTNDELKELKSMEHMESKDKLLEMLDDRCDGQGTVWLCGYGVYGHWFDNEFAYMNVGTSCD